MNRSTFQSGSLRGVPALDGIDSDARELDESSLAALISFFRVLDRWEREAKSDAETV